MGVITRRGGGHDPSRRVGMLVGVLVVGLVGCSGVREETEPSAVGTTVTPAPTTSVAPVQVTEPEPAWTPARVMMTVAVEPTADGEAGPGVQADLEGDVTSAAAEPSEPFGQFASCSGVRRAFGPYSVLVSSTDGPVSAAALFIAESVVGPGIYDADVRIERRSGAIDTATGTVTLAGDLRSGSFLAFATDGAMVSGTFACSGGDPLAAPLRRGSSGDENLHSVEVVALMRRGDAERVVSLAVEVARSADITVACPGAGSAAPVVLVDGDASAGSIDGFELGGGTTPRLQLRIGGTPLVFEAVMVAFDDAARSGTFSAVRGDLSIDGAFRCS